MATHQNKDIDVKVARRTKVETTYEYVPIFGEVLGYWRRTYVGRFGDGVHIAIRTPLEEYDSLYINDQEIPIPKSPIKE